MSRSRETELKLELEPAAADDFKNHPALKGLQPDVKEQVSVYYDTEDEALRKGGFSLRVRQSGSRFVQTVKQNEGDSAGLFDRPEWEQDVEGLEIDFDEAEATPLGPLLTGKLRKRLQPVIRSEVTRTRWNVERPDGALELVLDVGSVTGGEQSQPLVEAELELRRGEADVLFAFARDLADGLRLRVGVLTKAERGYALLAGTSGKARKASPIVLPPDCSAAEGFAAICHSCLRQYRLNENVLLSDTDPTALHQARVATRRLRSAFSLFRRVAQDEEYERLRLDLRALAAVLGEARNLDVLIKRLSPPGKDAAGKTLLKILSASREEAYAKVHRTLTSSHARQLILELVAWAEAGAWRDSKQASRPLRKFAIEQLDKRWRKVKKAGRMLAELETEPRHRLRIDIKKLRYAIEFLASLNRSDETAAKRKAFLEALEEMQERLGDLNDLETAQELLSQLLAGQKDAKAMIGHATRTLGQAKPDEQIASSEAAYARFAEVGPFWR